MSYVGRNRGRRGFSVGRPRRRSTTVKLQDKARFRGAEYSVYTNKLTPEHERVIFPRDSDFLRAPVNSMFRVKYLGETYAGKKSVRMVRRGNQTVTPAVLVWNVTGGK